MPELRRKLRQVESMTDVPVPRRKGWLLSITAAPPTHQRLISLSIRRTEHSAKKARYPIFFDIAPLTALAFSDKSRN